MRERAPVRRARRLAWAATRFPRGPTGRCIAITDEIDFGYATHDDIDEVVELVNLAYRGEPGDDSWTSEAELLDGQRLDAEMLADTLDRPGTHVLLARTGGELAACCELQRPRRAGDLVPPGEVAAEDVTTKPLHEERKLDEPPPEEHPDGVDDGAAYFGMFSVRPGIQGSGVGGGLLDEAERIAREEWRAESLELTVIHLREELIGWYERRGYARTGAEKDFPDDAERFGRPKREGLRLVVLRKPLAAAGAPQAA